MTRLLCTFFIFAMFGSAMGQFKYEKEVRIQEDSVPSNALEFVNSLHFDQKIRWYKEFRLETTTVEAKTKFRKKRYSIEFNMDGELEDVEVQTKWNEVPGKARSSIDAFLISKYKNYVIDRLQVQYNGKVEAIKAFLLGKTGPEGLEVKYEMVFHTRVNKHYKKFEYLFSADGEYLKSSEIVQKNSDNIEY